MRISDWSSDVCSSDLQGTASLGQEELNMKAPRVTLDQWRTLQAVVDHGGFAQAAEVLHRSQSSVSYTVARMQDQLGVPLLRIDGRKAVLTEAGGVLLRRSRQLVKTASTLEELAHHRATDRKG